MTDFSMTYPATIANSQDGFDVAVVIPSVLRDSLKQAIESIYAQRFDGTIQILIGIDKDLYQNKAMLKTLIDKRPHNIAVTVMDVGYSTFSANGGLYGAMGGGAIRPVLTLLANSRYVAYLDDDNWLHADHIQLLKETIAGKEWAFGLRWLCTPEGELLGPDTDNSIGLPSQIQRYQKDKRLVQEVPPFADPNSVMIDKLACEAVLLNWLNPFLDDGCGADRRFARALFSGYAYGISYALTTYYRYGPEEQFYQKGGYQAEKYKDHDPQAPAIRVVIKDKKVAHIQQRSLRLRRVRQMQEKSHGLLIGFYDPDTIDLIFRNAKPDHISIYPSLTGWPWEKPDEGKFIVPPKLVHYFEQNKLSISSKHFLSDVKNTEDPKRYDWIMYELSPDLDENPADTLAIINTVGRHIKTTGFFSLFVDEKNPQHIHVLDQIAGNIQGTLTIERPSTEELLMKVGSEPDYLGKSQFIQYRRWKGENVYCRITSSKYGEAEEQISTPSPEDFEFVPEQKIDNLTEFWLNHRPVPYCYDARDYRLLFVLPEDGMSFDLSHTPINILRKKAVNIASIKWSQFEGLIPLIEKEFTLPQTMTVIINQSEVSSQAFHENPQFSNGAPVYEMDHILAFLLPERHFLKNAEQDVIAKNIAHLTALSLAGSIGLPQANLCLYFKVETEQQSDILTLAFPNAKRLIVQDD